MRVKIYKRKEAAYKRMSRHVVHCPPPPMVWTWKAYTDFIGDKNYVDGIQSRFQPMLWPESKKFGILANLWFHMKGKKK